MSDQITRYQVNSDDSKTVKYQVQDNINNDKLVRYQVQSISGSQPDPVLESLTVTANGTYTPPEGVDGFNKVIANFKEANNCFAYIKSVYDESSSQYVVKDVYRDFIIETSNLNVSENSIKGTSRNSLIKSNIAQPYFNPIMIEVNINDYDISAFPLSTTSELNSNYFSVINFGFNKATLYGIYFDVYSDNNGNRLGNDFKYKFYTGSQPAIGASLGPEACNGKKVKLYLNCDYENNNIIFSKNKFIVTIDDNYIFGGDCSTPAGTAWDQFINIGWSSYNWGCGGIDIKSIKAYDLSKLINTEV